MSQVSYGSITITDATDGVQSAIIYLYRNSDAGTDAAPSVPSNELTYTFSTGRLSGTLNGWQQSTVNLDTSRTIWLITAMALSSDTTDDIQSSEWSQPRPFSQTAGQDGQDGLNQATVFIYKRGTEATKPTTHPTYTFSDGSFTPPTGWSKTIPTANGNPCFVTAAVAIGNGATATLGEWADVTVLAQDGFSPTVSKTGDTVTIAAINGTVTISDGISYYTHIRYSANSNGANYQKNPDNTTTYIGVYTGTSSTAPVYTDEGWTWSKYVGSPGAQGVSIISIKEVYYHTTGSAPAQNTLPNGTPIISTSTGVNTWTTVVPKYVTGGNYYTSLQTTLSAGTSPIFSPIVLNEGLTDSNYNAAVAKAIAQSSEENSIGALSIARGVRQHFFQFPDDVKDTIPAGAYVAEESEDVFKAGPAKGNLLTRADGIWIRNGANVLAALQGNGLSFFVPSGNWQGKLGMKLSATSLIFYNIDSTNASAAMLDASGLKISHGGIEAGAKNTANYIYINSNDDATNHKLTINNHETSDWRIIAGKQFGVDKAGNLYASNAYIKGKIEADTGYIASSITIGSGGTSLSSLQSDLSTALQSSVEYIVGTHGATATNVWTGTTRDTTLVVGKTIAFYMTSAGTTTAATLNLTLAGGGTTGAIGVRINNSNVTTHFPQYTIVNLTYDGTYWKCDNYNSDTYNRTRWQNVITAATAITSGRIICGTSSGYKNIAANIAFDMAYPLLYAGSNLAAAATGDNNYLEINGVNASSNGTITSGAANKVLYLKGTLSGNTFTISASPFLTTVVPTSQDNICYIPIGVMYSATSIYFKSSDQIYAYKDGAFGPISLREASGAAKTATNYITNIDSNNGITIKAINGTTDTNATTGNYIKLNASGLYIYKGGIEQAYFTGTATAIGTVGKGRIIIKNDGLHVYDYVSNAQRDIAYFGNTARVGLSTGSHFMMNASSLQAFDDTGAQYFEVSASGVKFGASLGSTVATTTQVSSAKGNFTILWNYENFTTANNGEAYICKLDALTNTSSDANGTVMWNGTNRTITKQMVNPNTIAPYNIPIYIVCRLSSAEATTGTNYIVWYNSGWKYATLPTPTAVGGTWTWDNARDIILGKFVEPSSDGAFIDYEIYNPPLSSKQLTTVTTTAAAAQSTADTAKTNAAAAQSTADTAKTNAAAAQSTANTAKTNAATAQSTANTAKADAATAQTTANTAKADAATAQTTATNAAKTATNYIANIDSNKGITIKPITSTGNDYLQINSTAIDFFRDGQSQLCIQDSWIAVGKQDGTRITMHARNDDPYIYMNANGHDAFRLDANGVHIYDTNSKERVLVNANGMTIKNASGTTVATYGESIALASNGANITIGQVAADKYNAYITTSNFQIRNNTTAIATFGSSISLASNGATVTIGKVAASNYNAYITTSNFQIRNNTTAIASFGSSITLASNGATITLGQSTNTHTTISTSSFTITDGDIDIYKLERTNSTHTLTTSFNKTFHSSSSNYTRTTTMSQGVSTWSKFTVYFKVNNGATQTASYTSNLPPTDSTKKFYLKATYSRSTKKLTMVVGRGSAATSSENITVVRIKINYTPAQTTKASMTIGAYADTTESGPLRIGNGYSSLSSNAALIDWKGNLRIAGDIYVHCDDDSTGGLSISDVYTSWDAYEYTSGNNLVKIGVQQVGYLVTLNIQFRKVGTTGTGVNFYTQDLRDSHIPTPVIDGVSGFCYANNVPMGLFLGNINTGYWQLNIRNLSPSSVTDGSARGSLVYVWDGEHYTDDE